MSDSDSSPITEGTSGLTRGFILPLAAATVGTIALMVGVLMFHPAPPENREGAAQGTAAGSATRARPADVLFKELCALCHGENGDGQGATQLERPARSFIEGGYGYGNTLGVLMRTLEHGIPGTAMPAFGETLSLQERTSLAQYVLSLGPPIRTVSISEGNVRPASRAVALHGALSDPTTDQLEPRSLLIGFSDGTSAQYRTRDLAVVEIRKAEPGEPFAQRADWRGQGGAPLRALGSTAWSLDLEETVPVDFVSAAGAPLSRHHLGTRLMDGEALLRFELRNPSGERVGEGTETVRSLGGAEGTWLVRTLELTPEDNAILRAPPAGESLRASARGDDGLEIRQVRPGLLAVDPSSSATTRHYVHAQSWRSGLAATL